MGKTSRKAKAKKKDFQKVKLKVGKRKPKGDNFTETRFKSKAIVVADQLKSRSRGAAEQPTNRRKQNIQEILVHFNHYNSSVRRDSVLGLKDLLATHPEVLETNLAPVLENLSALLTDTDGNVRSAVTAVLKAVLPRISPVQITPFFAMLNAHLCCAMTHIHEDIQLDSLDILDLCLENFPQHLSRHSQEILPNFLDQISGPGGKKANPNDLTRRLTVNPESRLSSQKWRLKILSKLLKYLGAVVGTGEGSVEQAKEFGQKPLVAGRSEEPSPFPSPSPPSFMDSSDDDNDWEVPPSSRYHLPEGPSVVQEATKDGEGSSMDQMAEFIRTLVPLLLQTWVEAGPGLLATDLTDSRLSQAAMKALHVVLATLSLLWQYMASQEPEGGGKPLEQQKSLMGGMNSLYLKDFRQHLLTCFPYAAAQEKSGGKKRQQMSKKGDGGALGKSAAVSVGELNLMACNLMSFFLTPANSKEHWSQAMTEYLLDSIKHSKGLSPSLVKQLLVVVKRLARQGLLRPDSLYQPMFNLYKRLPSTLSNKQMLVQFVGEIASRKMDQKETIKKNSVLQRWLEELPSMLCDKRKPTVVTVRILLAVLYQLLAQGNDGVCSSLQNVYCQAFDPNDGLLFSLPNELQLSLIQLLFYIPHIDRDTFVQLNKCCLDDRLSANNVSSLLHILVAKKTNALSRLEATEPYNIADFCSFLFTILTGKTKAELTDLQTASVAETFSTNKALPYIITTVSKKEFEHQLPIVQAACSCLKSLLNETQRWKTLQNFILNILTTYKVLPASTVHSIATATTELYAGTAMIDRCTDLLAWCCLASLSHSQFTSNGVMSEAAMNLVVVVDGLCNSLVERMKEVVQDSDSLDSVQSIAGILVAMLQSRKLDSRLSKVSSSIRETVECIQENDRVAQGSSTWLSDLEYQLKLLEK